ncbi:MAG: hypothetical protein AB7U61_08595 [Methylocystis sp.]
METILEPLLKVGGITGLVIAVFYLIYRQILSLSIFSKLGATQTFVVITAVAFLVWSVAMSALFLSNNGSLAVIAGQGNSVQQNVRNR